jgi:trehalose 6-phosphate synthase/phosphatase
MRDGGPIEMPSSPGTSPRSQKKRIIVVANRLPVTVAPRKEGLKIQESPGGLAAGLRSLRDRHEVTFVGWPGYWPADEAERGEIERTLARQFDCRPLFIPPQEISKYYNGFSNKALWPLFHYFPARCTYDGSEWEAYKRVNQAFLEAVLEEAGSADTIWVHDYHLMLLPALLRKSRPAASIGFFLHIPFPSYEMFRLLPWRTEMLEGLLGADLVGFHTYEYARHFLNSLLRLLGREHEFGWINIDSRQVKADNFPMGIDIRHIEGLLDEPPAVKEIGNVRRDLRAEERKIVLSVDRLDYTKGIPRRLEGLESFLESHPEWHGRFIHLMLCVPSRTKVPQYSLLKEEVDRMVGRINGRFGKPGWMPIHYLYQSLPFERLAALYAVADVALVSPIRDGMNLVAKEYVAARRGTGGVLILSETAGASFELGEALTINVNSREDLASALERALRMPLGEQEGRIRTMQNRLREYDIYRWVQSFLESLQAVKEAQRERQSHRLGRGWSEGVVAEFGKARRALLLLDYGGTLVPSPREAPLPAPDYRLVRIMKMLAGGMTDGLVVVSGMGHELMERWLGGIRCGLVAEGGAWVKRGGAWAEASLPGRRWKEPMRPVLEDYAMRVPGSRVGESEFGLTWDYGKADPELGRLRGAELADHLTHFLANENLRVSHGGKVVEVRDAAVNKGQAVLPWLADGPWDLILAVGDDWTDEDLFRILPPEAYSIKVPYGPSSARFYLDSYRDVRRLLLEMAKARLGGR